MCYRSFCTQCLAADVNTARGQKTIRELGNILDLQRHAVEEDDNYESFIDYDHQFHLLLVQYIKNEEVNSIFQRLMYLIRLTSQSALVLLKAVLPARLTNMRSIMNILRTAMATMLTKYSSTIL